MREQCVPGSLHSSPAQEPGNEATRQTVSEMIIASVIFVIKSCCRKGQRVLNGLGVVIKSLFIKHLRDAIGSCA